MAEREVTQPSSAMEFSLQDEIYGFFACSSDKIIPVNRASLWVKEDPRLNILLLCQVGAGPGHGGCARTSCPRQASIRANPAQWQGQCPVFWINKYRNTH